VSWKPFVACDFAEMADIAESIEELRGGTLEELAWAAATGPAMGGGRGIENEP
jgi:hypothetical protein